MVAAEPACDGRALEMGKDRPVRLSCTALALLMTRVNTVMAPLTALQPSTNMGVDRVREYYVLVKVPGSNVD